MRFLLAFACFFRLLFGGRLPTGAVRYLPEDAARELLGSGEPEETEEAGEAADERAAEPAKPSEPAPKKPTTGLADHHRDGALALLSLLQREGRLVDFLREDLGGYEDGDIGAAVRDIHRGCKKILEEHFALEAVMPGEEDDSVDVPRGFDPGEIRLIGEADGEPPFKGVLRHHGWRVVDVKFPTLSEGVDRRVLAPAEVELQ